MIDALPRAVFGLPIVHVFIGDPHEPDKTTIVPVGRGRLSSPVITKACRGPNGWQAACVVLRNQTSGPLQVDVGGRTYPANPTPSELSRLSRVHKQIDASKGVLASFVEYFRSNT